MTSNEGDSEASGPFPPPSRGVNGDKMRYKPRTRPDAYRPYEASEIIYKMSELLSEGRRVVLASVVKAVGSAPRHSAAKMIVTEQGVTYGSIGGGAVETLVQRESKKVFATGKPVVIEADLGDDSWSGISMACGGKVEILIELVRPNPRLVILGAGHTAESIAGVARNMGHVIVVIDPLTKVENFPSADEVLTEGYETGLARINPTKDDTVIICTRTHQYDEKALRAAIDYRLGYLGVLGSRNRSRLVISNLIRAGVPEYKLAEVRTPMGLDIGAETPEEVAVSVMAEVLMVRRGCSGMPKTIKPPILAEEEISEDGRERH